MAVPVVEEARETFVMPRLVTLETLETTAVMVLRAEAQEAETRRGYRVQLMLIRRQVSPQVLPVTV